MITRSPCSKRGTPKLCKYCLLPLTPGSLSPLVCDLVWIQPPACRKVGRYPGHLMSALLPHHTLDHETLCGIMRAFYCMPWPSLGLRPLREPGSAARIIMGGTLGYQPRCWGYGRQVQPPQ